MASASPEHRTHLDIIASILDACHYGTTKTHVMYRSNLCFKQLKQYMDLLLKANLLLIESDRPFVVFRVSGKGVHFLKAYHSLMNMME